MYGRWFVVLMLMTISWVVMSACSDSSSDDVSLEQSEEVANQSSRSLASNLVDGCVDEFDPDLDYFPDKADLEFATNFSIEYHGHYKTLTVNEPYPGGDAQRYVLLQCGAPSPELIGEMMGATIVEIPISTIFTSSTTHLPMLVELGRVDALRGVAQAGFISSAEVLEVISDGEVVEFAPTFAIDAELVIDSAPDVLMASGTGPSDAHEALSNADVDVVWNGEWLEETPLGRSEWLKMVAALFNDEARADEAFEDIADAYQSFVSRTAEISDADRPSVMTGIEFGGIFYASGGRSFAAHLIRDAGGYYVWSDDEGTSSIETDIETQLERAGDSDYWLNAGAFWMSLQDVADADERYTEFAPYRDGQIWTNNLAVNDAGANDYFELGVLRPDLVLADMVSILHPSLAEGHEPHFYRRLQR